MAMACSVRVLDGGTGHLMKDKGIIIPGLAEDYSFLASCLACVYQADLVVDVHWHYIEAGCTVITTNNFVATPYHMSCKEAISIGYLQVVQVRCPRRHVHLKPLALCSTSPPTHTAPVCRLQHGVLARR